LDEFIVLGYMNLGTNRESLDSSDQLGPLDHLENKGPRKRKKKKKEMGTEGGTAPLRICLTLREPIQSLLHFYRGRVEIHPLAIIV